MLLFHISSFLSSLLLFSLLLLPLPQCLTEALYIFSLVDATKLVVIFRTMAKPHSLVLRAVLSDKVWFL